MGERKSSTFLKNIPQPMKMPTISRNKKKRKEEKGSGAGRESNGGIWSEARESQAPHWKLIHLVRHRGRKSQFAVGKKVNKVE